MSENLLELVKKGESEEVEFKKSTAQLDGIAYKRVGTENVVVPSEELERIILEKRKRYFDSEICEEASLEDIDDEKVRWFLRKAKVERDLDVDENTPVEEALRRLKLIKDNISGETARLDFIDLVNKDILKKVGRTKGVYYILSPKLSPIYLQKSKIEGHTEDKKT